MTDTNRAVQESVIRSIFQQFPEKDYRNTIGESGLIDYFNVTQLKLVCKDWKSIIEDLPLAFDISLKTWNSFSRFGIKLGNNSSVTLVNQPDFNTWPILVDRNQNKFDISKIAHISDQSIIEAINFKYEKSMWIKKWKIHIATHSLCFTNIIPVIRVTPVEFITATNELHLLSLLYGPSPKGQCWEGGGKVKVIIKNNL